MYRSNATTCSRTGWFKITRSNVYIAPLILKIDGYPRIHGLVYDLKNGLLKKLDIDFKAYAEKYQSIYSLYETNRDSGLLLSRQADFVKATFNGDGDFMDADKFFTGERSTRLI
jgi:hypothetical protein